AAPAPGVGGLRYRRRMAIVRRLGDLRPVIGAGVLLTETATVIGDVVVGDAASIWYGAVLRGDVMPIRVGARTSIQDNAVVHVTAGVAGTTIGAGVTVGHGAIVHACTVEDDCIIGMGSVLLDRARIGRGSIVGAGAVVTPGTDIPPGSLVIGSPARVKRAISDEERAWIASSAAHYVELSQRYLAASDPVG
ncbi:MAG: gamma carbonic anhydrase family protein, partial [Kofleriaceae bacterium]